MSKSQGESTPLQSSSDEPNSPLDWDPMSPSNMARSSRSHLLSSNDTPKSLQCISRVKRDMLAIYNDPPPGIFVIQDEQDLTLIHALITGSLDTPYAGGFFYFVVRCPPDYPIKPPKVKFMTTAAGTVRFNPNLYKCGKVCISILGTWAGPAWSPALTIASVLISIQSLLTEKPYHNEPGYEREKYPGASRHYNEIIQHETLRVAVCGMVENDYGLSIPKPLVDVINQSFEQFYTFYDSIVTEKMHLSGQSMQDPFGEHHGQFNYKQIKIRLDQIYEKLKTADSGASSSSCSPQSD